ncbi:LLM class F420-dependent oxidoreductase [Conexibacter sp. CPCC 206217]|uniref:LLM class F420-dependent oxidoreductase n=1 Tax=Conexibacter sp. CPCC 206217 TaxID=3064574 RepID=UPI00271A1C09|nr:LLM class F420-dependent oxidoreductase [Conexibacter sp. CPCC 206217]MDO8209556.1 LLM class F420-dependent oxidoreductase [Conexibacter sp. CPCC 206217]
MAMTFGVSMFPTDDGLPPAELAALAEELGFESLFFPEHTHMPVDRRSHFKPEGGELASEYARTLDPFVALMAAAAATERLLIGTGICLVVQRDPITTAKEVATLDLLSGGRFLFGVGLGWNREEMRNHGTDPRTRTALLRERIEAMQAIWREDEASYDGRFVAFERIMAWPKPLQRPHPPILVGGTGPTVLERVLAYGDEWLPEPSDGLLERMVELQERARAAGRDPVPITVYSARPEDVASYEAAGAHRCVFWLPARDPDGARRRIRELAQELGLAA